MVASTKVFVGSLPQGVKPEELRRLFESYGVVTECDIMNRCGFVHMETAEMAANAIKALNSTPFKGQSIVVEPGRPKEKSANKGNQARGARGGKNIVGKNTGGKNTGRGNRAGNGSRGRGNGGGTDANQVMNPGDLDDSALQLCSALFIEMNKMMNQNSNPGGGSAHQENNNVGGGRGRRQRGRNVGMGVGKGGGGGGGSSATGAGRADGGIQRGSGGFNKKQQKDNGNIGPVRNDVSFKQMRNPTPYNRGSNSGNNYSNPNVGFQSNSGGFSNNGNFGNNDDGQFDGNDRWRGGCNGDFGNNYNDDGAFSGNYGGNNMSGPSGMGGNLGNFDHNAIGQDRFNSAGVGNTNGNYGMGNQDRRGFALPEREMFNVGQQMGAGQQLQRDGGMQGNFRSGNQAPVGGRNFEDMSQLSAAILLSRSNNQDNSNDIFTRRNANFGGQNMSNTNRLGNQQQNSGVGNKYGRVNARGGALNVGGGGGLMGNMGGGFNGSGTSGGGGGGGGVGNNRNMSNNGSNFQNDFPPIGGLGGGAMNRNTPRQNMMSNRRF